MMPACDVCGRAPDSRTKDQTTKAPKYTCRFSGLRRREGCHEFLVTFWLSGQQHRMWHGLKFFDPRLCYSTECVAWFFLSGSNPVQKSTQCLMCTCNNSSFAGSTYSRTRAKPAQFKKKNMFHLFNAKCTIRKKHNPKKPFWIVRVTLCPPM